MNLGPDTQVVLIAAACSAAVGLLGIAALTWWPRRSVRAALLGASLVGVLAVLAGVVGTAQAMFLSDHDFGVVLRVSLVAGPVGLLVAFLLGGQVIRDVRELRASARALSRPSSGPVAPPAARSGRRAWRTARARPAMSELAEVQQELLRSGRRLDEARRREQALESSRRELIAWISHDLRTPLAGLRAMAEALEDRIAADPARYHRQIRREVDRLARMVDDLFELSRIQSGALTLSLQPVPVADLVADVLGGTRPVADALGVRLGSRIVPATVDADPAGLTRVLANLVINAIRHTPSDGTVEVVADQDRQQVVLSVTDRCGGLPPEHLARVFDAGWRAEGARTPQPDGGAGLGLAIARGIVEAHRGQIAVENVDGGCRFVVRLPRLEPAG